MDREKLESLLIDYIDGVLDNDQKQLIEKELSENKEAIALHNQLRELLETMNATKELAPSTHQQDSFDAALKNEIAAQGRQRKQVFFTPVFYRAAAALALVLSGVAIGYWINKNQVRDEELASLRKEMSETKQMMISMMQNDQSASQRIQGINVALMITEADDEIVNALAKTLNSDPNTNVRLAALDALSKFISESKVRSALIESLSKQDDPVVQIALIQLLVRIKEKGVVNDLEDIIKDEKTIPAVKDEAYTGLLQLS